MIWYGGSHVAGSPTQLLLWVEIICYEFDLIEHYFDCTKLNKHDTVIGKLSYIHVDYTVKTLSQNNRPTTISNVYVGDQFCNK